MSDRSALLSIARRRMRSTLLWTAPRSEPEQVVGWFGAVQAQDYEPAKWGVAMRTKGAASADLDVAVDDGRIVRTHVLRPTWHFVLPKDIRWLQALTGPRVHTSNSYHYRRHGLDGRLLARCERLIVRWLEADGDLSRKEIGERLGREGIGADGNRLAYVLMSAEVNGVVCSGRRRGSTHTYALVSRRAPDALELSEDQALGELTFRYFQSHGPATLGDFRWWSSLTVHQIRRGLEILGSRLHSETLGDHEVWSVDPTSVDPPASPTVHLLQAFDEYTVAFSDTKGAVDAAGHAARPGAREGRAFANTLIIDGQLAGHWRRTVSRGRVTLEVRPLRAFSEIERERLDGAVAAYGRFHGIPVQLSRWTAA